MQIMLALVTAAALAGGGVLAVDATLDSGGGLKLNADVSNWIVRGTQTQLTHMVFANATGKYDLGTDTRKASEYAAPR